MELADDMELMERFRHGDEDAFRELLVRCAGLLRARVSIRMPKDILRRVSLADVLQEASIVAFQRREHFRQNGPASFRNWLLGIVDKKAQEAIQRHRGARMRAVTREVTRGQRPDTAQVLARQPSPSEHAIAAETADRARRALQTLPAHYQMVLRLAREDCLPLREVAEKMGSSRETIKKLYGRALCRFTKVFDRLGDT